jgi:galactokinase
VNFTCLIWRHLNPFSGYQEVEMPLDGTAQLFRDTYGHDPDVIGIAPGRINLIGEHTDYNDGFVFPAAIDRGLWIAASLTKTETETVSAQMGRGEPFSVGKVQSGFTDGWTKYVAGMAWAISENTEHLLPNLKIAINSTIPISGGVSSSAALEMALGVVWNYLGKLALDNRELARLGQFCENRFVGVNCGIMDQMASAMGREGQAMFFDTRTQLIEYVQVPDNLTVVLCDTKKERTLATSAYNERRAQCEMASQYLGVKKLRDADLGLLNATKAHLPEVVYRRARHIITENTRCQAFRQALSHGDHTLIGILMRDSHQSLRRDFEVSCDELDAMAESAWAAPGCVGARMMGGGFGGSCIALVQSDKVGPFIEATLEIYKLASGLAGDAMTCGIVDGARLLVA